MTIVSYHTAAFLFLARVSLEKSQGLCLLCYSMLSRYPVCNLEGEQGQFQLGMLYYLLNCCSFCKLSDDGAGVSTNPASDAMIHLLLLVLPAPAASAVSRASF